MTRWRTECSALASKQSGGPVHTHDSARTLLVFGRALGCENSRSSDYRGAAGWDQSSQYNSRTSPSNSSRASHDQPGVQTGQATVPALFRPPVTPAPNLTLTARFPVRARHERWDAHLVRFPAVMPEIRTVFALPRIDRSATTASGVPPALAPTASTGERPKGSPARRLRKRLPPQLEAATTAARAASSALTTVAARESFP